MSPSKCLLLCEGNSVDLVVRRHDGLYVSFLDGCNEGFQEIFANDAFRDVAWSDVGAAFRLAVHCKMLRCGHHVRIVDERSDALETLDRGDTYARDEIWIFSVGFFGAAPARIARKIQHRC